MTRSTIRLAQVCAAALAAGILAAALAQSTRAGMASTARYLVIVAATGGVLSASWHGVRILLERREERRRAQRRHRVPRPDRLPTRPAGARRPPTADPALSGAAPAPGVEPVPEAHNAAGPQIEQAWHDFAQSIDPYQKPPTPQWMSASEAAMYEDLYAHRSPSST